jgi:hypothetical protein
MWRICDISLTNSKTHNVFTAVEQIDNEKVIDKTHYAKRESWEGAQIGLTPESVDIKHNLLTDEHINNFFIEYKQ